MSKFDPNSYGKEESTSSAFDPNSYTEAAVEQPVIEQAPETETTIMQDMSAVADSVLSGTKQSAVGAAVRGIAESATLGLNKHISSGINAGIEYAMGTDKSIGQLYNKYKTDYDLIRTQDRLQQSGANIAGQAVGILGPVGLANKAAKGAKVLQSSYRAAQIGKMALFDAGIDVASNVAKNITDVQDKNLNQIMDEAYSSFLFSGLGQSAVAVLGKTAKSIGDTSTMRYINNSLNSSTAKYKKGVQSYVEKATKGSTDPLAKEAALNKAIKVLNDNGLDKIDVISTPGQLKANFIDSIDATGQEISKRYSELDEIYGSTISMKPVNDKVTSYFSNVMITSKSPTRTAEAQKAFEMIRGEVYDSASNQAKQYGMTDLWELRKNLWGANSKQYLADRGITNKDDVKFIKNTIDDFFQSKRTSVLGSATQEVAENSSKIASLKQSADQMIEQQNLLKQQLQSLGKVNPDDANALAKAAKLDSDIASLQARIDTNTNEFQKAYEFAKADLENAAKGIAKKTTPRAQEIGKEVNDLNQKYQDLIEVKKGFIDNMDIPETDSGILLNVISNTYKNIKQPFGVFAAKSIGGTAGVTAKVLGKPVLGAMADTLESFSKTTLDNMVYKSSQSAARFFRNSESLGDDVFNNRLISQFVSTLNDDELSADEAGIKFDSLKAQQNLYLAPLKRTTEDVKKRIDDVMDFAKEINPELAGLIADSYAVDDYDTIAGYLDTLSKNKETAKFFEAGQGWDGKIYDPAERQMMSEQIRNNLSIPVLQREKLIIDFLDTGIVPDVNQFKRPEPKPLMARDKNKVR